ncbi:nucleolus protein [Hortaea werneckii]|nr:nucleolus protein [Hortaea werneckii]KAI7082236.1 nucleolus protein [Hortaea werneckii]KAI7243524.1 nucleolus protein [Hortaea werneckii]KAI7307432.1 nucleolus protein [Hortaea werneckii]KAI7391766.1 nucleolus protein [Hortaea werneckii]
MSKTKKPALKAKQGATAGFSKGHGASGISKGRPPLAKKPTAALSAEKTRQLIRTHHQLNKELAKAEALGDHEGATELKKRIEAFGGLESYQQASIQGQAKDRGGDSSVILMEWLKPAAASEQANPPRLRLLEVGALSTKNACSKSAIFDIERIDLNSQAEGIKQQDFMERPLPSSDSERFDVISLSLVLNYVPEAEGRGEMLRRTCQFLRAEGSTAKDIKTAFPALFLVLPAPCIFTSRYMNEERLSCVMASLGYVLLRFKHTHKLMYTLWQLRDEPAPRGQSYPKKEVNPGGNRNNFSVVLRPS